jgi:hypothetical protein
MKIHWTKVEQDFGKCEPFDELHIDIKLYDAETTVELIKRLQYAYMHLFAADINKQIENE